MSALRLSMKIIMKKKVFVSGCYDLLHSGHVEFFQQASQYGDLYVGIGVSEDMAGEVAEDGSGGARLTGILF